MWTLTCSLRNLPPECTKGQVLTIASKIYMLLKSFFTDYKSIICPNASLEFLKLKILLCLVILIFLWHKTVVKVENANSNRN